jgi:predicted amidohydrolase
MARRLRISVVAPRPLAEDPGAGQAAVDRMITFWQGRLEQVLPDRPDLIVVPEACDRYPAHDRPTRQAYYRARGDQVRDLFARVARDHACHLAYSAARLLPDGTWRNSTQLLGPDGRAQGVYNKNHPTIPESVEDGILAGREAPVFDCRLGRVACAICFDLNFDSLRQHYAQARPDLVLFSSVYHGGLMQTYWAYSCRAHFVAAVAGLPSAVISPVGQVVASTTNYFDCATATVNLDCAVAHLDCNWERLRAMKEKYGPEVTVSDPGHLASVLITSESPDRAVGDLVAEFGIELLDDYLRRSEAHDRDPRYREPAPS